MLKKQSDIEMIGESKDGEELIKIKTVYKGDNFYCKDTTVKLAKLLAYSNFMPIRQKNKPIFSEKEIAIIRLICKEYSSQGNCGAAKSQHKNN